MMCEISTKIVVKNRTYENTFRESIPLEEEGLSRADLDPEGVLILCEECGKNVYPLDWVEKTISHGRIHPDLLDLDDHWCVRCLGSTKRLVNHIDCDFCNKLKNKK